MIDSNFYKYIKKNWKNLLIISLILTVIILIMSTTCSRRENKILNNNVKALTDSVHVLKTKNGDLVYAKQSLILEKKEIEKYLDISKSEIKDLEKKLKSSLAYISSMKGGVRIDSIIMFDTIVINGSGDTISVKFNYDDKWVSLNGRTLIYDTIGETHLDKLEIETPLKVGLTEDYKVFVLSDNPYLKISEIDGAAIENSVIKQKKKRFGIGPYIGFGIGGGTSFNKTPYFGWNVSVGLCLTYSLIQF